jgi:arylsulfatase A-like enzyme
MKNTQIFSLLASISCMVSCDSIIANDKSPVIRTPNVLFISIDDLRPELGCYGKDYIKSPHMDRVAESGSVFTNHYVQVPTCGASRFSLLTGMFPQTTGHLGNGAIQQFISRAEEAQAPETFIHHLRRNGYYTVGVGKISHSADGFLYGYTEPMSDIPELPYSWDELLFDPGKWGTGWNAFFGYADGENRQSMDRQVKPYEMADVDDMGYPDGLIAQLALDKLDELVKKDQPFFMGVGFFKPHLPFNAPKKYWDMYDRNDIPLSPNPFKPKHVHNASLHASGEFNGYHSGDEKVSPDGPISDEYARTLIHAYFACISYIDAQVGKLLDKLEELGVADNTVVVIWGDHGWHLGDHLLWGKHSLFERALKSALIINVPGKTKGEIVNKIVSTTDIYPTIIELCGIEMPHQTDGKSLIPLLRNSDSQWEEAAYGYFKNGISLRTQQHRLTKYFRNQQPVVELYDHAVDPHETINVAEKHPEVIERLWPLWERGNTGLYEE